MLLSFSEPAMLPMVINGLHARGASQDGNAAWAYDNFRDEIEAAGERTKLQTIRPNNGDLSIWHRAGPGWPLQLWWKSRTPGRRFLGKVPCRAVSGIEIGDVAGGPYQRTALINSLGKKSEGSGFLGAGVARRVLPFPRDLDDLARRDGFADTDEFFAYFLLRRKVFSGFLIEW